VAPASAALLAKCSLHLAVGMESYLRNTTIRSLNFGNLLPMFRFSGEVGPLCISASAGRPSSREVRARGVQAGGAL